MSAVGTTRTAVRARLGQLPTGYRAAALAGATVLTGTYLVALYHVVDVVGSAASLATFVGEVLAAVVLAAALSRVLRLRSAVALGGLLLAAGLGAYALAVPGGAIQLEQQLADTVALVTGLSVLRMASANLWALGVTPAPLFVSTYLFLRRRYALGVLVGGATLAFFVSTGDVDVLHGLVGVLGAVAALGFGQLDREGGAPALRDGLLVLLVAVLVVTTSVSLVPGGEAQPLLPDDRGTAVEASLVGTGDRVTLLGSIELSPAVRFTVTADRAARWRVGAFDRYTGGGWVRAGQSRPYDDPLPRPPGDPLVQVRQTVEVESETDVMPAAWKPSVVEGAPGTRVTSMGGLEPDGTLAPGERYTVLSYRHDPGAAALRAAGTDYPDGLLERYTQLPSSTPDRLGEFAARLTDGADNPYDAARLVERWLEANKAYSLDVERPSGDVAASFVFDMNRGYCTYYATAMVAMLRTQGIPARFVTGYTAGESVAGKRWVVRGLDSHAWVEVYFPEHGWVAFDPTPAGPRRDAEQARVQRARAAGAADVDTDLSDRRTATPTPTPTPTPTAAAEPDAGAGGLPGRTITVPPGLAGVEGPDPTTPVGDAGGPTLPDERTVLYGLILLVGAATLVHRTGVLDRGRRTLWVRREPDGPPARRVEATFERLDYLLGRRYRPREPGETPRAYLDAVGPGDGTAVDPRLDEVFELYERARYAGRASPADADRAWRLFRALRADWSA